MPKLRKWIRKRFGSAYTNDNLNLSQPGLPPRLPVLPQKRPHALTPSSSSEKLPQTAIAESAFFQRLPPDLRRQIYIAAFGGRTVHMDLQYKYPDFRGEWHAHLDPQRAGSYDFSGVADWRWWSSVCHRDPSDDACNDRCRTAEYSTDCFLNRGKKPDECFLGVMGWLLTCRQAYMEGLDVLYSTNTVHIASIVLTRHLPLLLLPRSLASITSLELVWKRVFSRALSYPQPEEGCGWPAYHALVSVVASAFPYLKKLYVSVAIGAFTTNFNYPATEGEERDLFGPIDGIVRKLGPQLQDCQIVLPESLYRATEYGAKIVDAPDEPLGGNFGQRQRFWRPVTAEQGQQSESGLGYFVLVRNW